MPRGLRCAGLAVVLLVWVAADRAGAQAFADADGDGTADALDLCWQHPNPDQRDTDGDGIGNRCDPDFTNDGVVGLPDVNRFRSVFGCNVAAQSCQDADLNGDGVAGLPDFNILRAWFGEAPGPGQWTPPDTATCTSAVAVARLHCCPGYETDPPATSSVLLPTDCDCSGEPCVPSDFIEQECLPQSALASGSEQCPAPGYVADDQGEGGNAGCMAAIEAAKQVCGLGVDQHLDLVGDTNGGQVTTLPLCESLEEWKLDFTCDPFPKLRIHLTLEEQVAIDGAFSFDPEQGIWHPGPPKPPVVTPAIPLAFPFASAADANEPVSLIRVEVPGNLVRFHLARAALHPALQQLEDDLDGVLCDEEGLACDLDLLDMADLSDDIEAGSVGTALDDGLHYRVDKTADGYRVHSISFKAEDSMSLQVVATYTGDVEIYSEGSLHLDFDHDAYLGWLPLHDPLDANGYATALDRPDHQANYLDRSLVIFRISDAACRELADREIETPSGALVTPNGSYYTFVTPYHCRCNYEPPLFDYCVAESFPRPFDVLADNNQSPPALGPEDLPDARFHNVYCSAKDPRGLDPATIGTELLMADGLALPHELEDDLETAELTLTSLATRYGMDSGQRAQLIQDVHEFACSTQYANRRAVTPLIPLVFNDISMQYGRRVASAAGLRAALQATMPVLKAEVTPGVLELDFELGTSAERWLEDEWWTFPLGWLTSWFLEIFSALATIFSTILINLVAPITSIEFGDLQLLVDMMISHRTARLEVVPTPGLLAVRPEITLGVRRVAMNLPEIDVTPMELVPEWNSPSCELGNAEDFVDWALSLFLCPFEVASNLSRFAATPIMVLFKSLANLVIDAAVAPSAEIVDSFISNAALLEDGNSLGRLIANASRSQTLLPYYLEPGQTPANAPDQLGVDLSGLTPVEAARRLGATLPPPFAALCLGSNATSLNCFLAKLFLGSGDPFLPQLDVVRMGAKTHYRSMADVTSAFPVSENDYTEAGLSWDYPPVRYCVEGDQPPGSVGYDGDLLARDAPDAYLDFESDELLDDLTDFDEIEVGLAGDPTPTDWRAQCAFFADFKITTLYFLRRSPDIGGPWLATDAELRVQATKRTNFLLNEVLFCVNDAECDPTPPNAPMRARAELAACSMLADMWWRTCEVANCGDDPPYQNLLRDATASPGNLNWVRAILTRLANQAGSPALSTVLGTLGTRLPQCIGALEAEGYVIPPELDLP